MSKRKVHMHIEGVPNPQAMKFVLENGILVDKPYEFTALEQTEFSPLARRLMMLRYVERVMLNHNYVTVVKTQKNSPKWDEILFELRMLIQQHLESDQPILYYGAPTLEHERSEESIIELITQLLDQKIRPAAQEDGGDIVFESYKDGILNLQMHGACYLCPHAAQTIQQGVEPVLKTLIPEVKKVVARENLVS